MHDYTDIFTNWDGYEDLSTQYNLEDCGMSGMYPGYHWFTDNKEVNVYVREESNPAHKLTFDEVTYGLGSSLSELVADYIKGLVSHSALTREVGGSRMDLIDEYKRQRKQA